ncbi:hypothetical protein F4779DRAFT_611951 [Xylariaceae sp. FL0662B]|nr:hypothetical protein F4779DRAFT_611951 [Xylariaceae sp. FL0662B]
MPTDYMNPATFPYNFPLSYNFHPGLTVWISFSYTSSLTLSPHFPELSFSSCLTLPLPLARLQAGVEMATQYQLEPVAIIGFAFRFPGDATSPEKFLKILEEKRCVMSEIPAERMNIDGFHVKKKCQTDQINFRGAHFLNGPLGAFDAPFFSISSTEAAAMDPQQRGLLETSYHALETAGIPIEDFSGSDTAVFASSFGDDHRTLSLKDPENMSRYAGSGTAPSMLANRLSWWYNLKGPSLNIDTACSSSLNALHLACHSLYSRECSMALVGGSNIMSSAEQYLLMSNLSMLSPSSRSFSFDHRANGYGRGEGFGVVVVKRLSDAIDNGDLIRAVIRATGTNHNGRTPSLTSPSSEMQQELIRNVYAKAGLDLTSTAFVEAHGTGTMMGDPIEAQALGSVFGRARKAGDSLYVGSVKSNIGHLEGASGLAGLIKVILMLERGIIYPNANFEKTNPKIDADELNISFPGESTPWPTTGLRRASVNSFGFGGSNCHIVLEDACNFLKTKRLRARHLSVDLESRDHNLGSGPITAPIFRDGDRDNNKTWECPRLFTWSASSKKSLSLLLKRYSEFFALQHNQGFSSRLGELSWTLCARRSLLPTRSFAVISSYYQLLSLTSQASDPVRTQRHRKIGFIFTGQGAQYPKMGEKLLSYPVFRHSLEMSEEYLRELGCQWSLLDELSIPEPDSKIHHPRLSQPLCTALQIALVALLSSLGLKPRIVIGHSSGEIASAYSIGALDHRSAMKVAYYRGQVAADLATSPESRGSMAAVGLSEDQVSQYLKRFLCLNPAWTVVVACVNSPSSTTLAGDEVAIDNLEKQFKEDGIFFRKLRVSVAYHSPHIRKVSDHYRRLIGTLQPGDRPGQVSSAIMISSVTGQDVSANELLEAQYWVKNLESPVIFNQAVANLFSARQHRKTCEHLDMVEIGPYPALRGPFQDNIASLQVDRTVHYDAILTRKSNDLNSLMSAIGRLHCLGHPVDILRTNRQTSDTYKHSNTAENLPLYPFDHSQSYWHESRRSRDYRLHKLPRSELLGSLICQDGPPQMAKVWRKLTRAEETPWIMDHVVSGMAIYPAAGMLVMAIEAAYSLKDQDRQLSALLIKEADFLRPIAVSDDTEGAQTHIELGPWRRDGELVKTANFTICTVEGQSWVENSRGIIQAVYSHEAQQPSHHTAAIDQQQTKEIDLSDLYERFDSMGLSFGPNFQSLTNVTVGCAFKARSAVRTFTSSPNEQDNTQSHVTHPITLDGVFQTILVALVQEGASKLPTVVPTQVRNLWIRGCGVSYPSVLSLQVVAQVQEQSAENTLSTASAYDENGELCVSVESLKTSFIDSTSETAASVGAGDTCFSITWCPDIDLTKGDSLSDLVQTTPERKDDNAHFEDMSTLFLNICIHVLDRLEPAKLEGSHSYLRHYVDWMRQYVAHAKSDNESGRKYGQLQTDKPLIDGLSEKVAQYSAVGRGLVEVGKNLLGILHGEINPLELIFISDVAEQYYRESNARLETELRHVLELISFKQPGLRVLEIGAGTGATTELILKYARMQAGATLSAISSYEFTDISQAFFASAQAKFAESRINMSFSVLDVSKDAISQGFKEAHYDLVVAANVLHATPDLNVTLSNARKLLKPGGKLLVLEITDNRWLPQVIFGTLPGWWLSMDEYRTLGPCIPITSWNDALSRNQFSGVDLEFHDSPCPQNRICSVMVASAVKEQPHEIRSTNVVILLNHECEMSYRASKFLMEKLLSYGLECVQLLTLTEVGSHDFSNTFCISLLELFQPLIASMSEETFASLRAVFCTSKTIMWVRDTGDSKPELHLSDGLLRVLQSENVASTYIQLATDSTRVEETAINVVRVLDATLNRPQKSVELEYREIEGRICVSRATPALGINHHIKEVVKKGHIMKFDSNSTYVLAGGFGGVARSICRWMVNRGVRHLLLLSRSGPSTPAARDLLTDLTAQGVQIECPACDISSFDDLQGVLGRCTSRLPPIKGCIQGALVLQDSIFDNMTYKQWTSTLSPRVGGTQNLFQLLPDTSFFVLLSSIAGVLGNPSQANYAATNTYLDAFAQCHSTSRRAVSAIDVGWVEFTGTVAESESIQQRLAGLGCVTPIAENEFLALLEYCCDVERFAREMPKQIIIGIKNTRKDRSTKQNLLERPLWRAVSLLDEGSVSHNITTDADSENRISVTSMLAAIGSVTEATKIVMQAMFEKLATEFSIEKGAIESDKPLHAVGVDSLMAVQLRSWFRTEIGTNITVFTIMGNTCLGDLCKMAAENSEFVVREKRSELL